MINDLIAGQFGHVALHKEIRSRLISVKEFGAVGDGVTDDRATIQSAIDAASNHSTIYFPHGYYFIEGEGTELLLIDKPLRIKGETTATTLLVGADVGSSTDIIRVDISGTVRNLSFERFTIIPQSGTPGKNGINIDVSDEGQQIAELLISRVHIYSLGGNAIYLTNPTAINAFYHSWIEKCVLYKGINLQRCGDSVSICDNIITGSGIGINVSVQYGGVSQLLISHNNITCKSGAIRLESGDQTKIVYNQIEVPVGWDTSIGNDALIDIDGNDGSQLIMAEIVSNNINGNCQKVIKPTNLIRVNYATDLVIRDNNLQKGEGASILVTSNAIDTRIDHNHWGNAEIAPSIEDLGTNTWTLP